MLFYYCVGVSISKVRTQTLRPFTYRMFVFLEVYIFLKYRKLNLYKQTNDNFSFPQSLNFVCIQTLILRRAASVAEHI